MPLYFAYGANMDADAMAGRCPSSKALGRARLPRHRFIITKDGYASIVRSPFGDVHGVLWDLALSDIRSLDRFEALDRGLYCKLHQPVIVGTVPRRAMLYIATCSEQGIPRQGYLEAIVAAADVWKLPPTYVTELRRHFAGGAMSPRVSGTNGRPAAGWR